MVIGASSMIVAGYYLWAAGERDFFPVPPGAAENRPWARFYIISASPVLQHHGSIVLVSCRNPRMEFLNLNIPAILPRDVASERQKFHFFQQENDR